MASISRDPQGNRTIQFVGGDGKRRSVRLGKVSQRIAEDVKVRIESLNAAAIAGLPLDGETAAWVGRLGDDLAERLAAVKLIPRRERARLAGFLADYIGDRTDVKPRTRINLESARERLIEYFGSDKELKAISPGDADAWVCWLKERYANGTVGRTVRRAKQFFRAAVRRRLLVENPFTDVKAPSQVNSARKAFVSHEDAQKILDACPDVEWRLIFALARYGGLRTPSETLSLKWSDVDWERNRIRIPVPKLEHLDGHKERWIPLFPELRPHLEEAFDVAAPGTVYLINRYRSGDQNLRTHLLRIIRKADLKPWPKLFVNLRSTRETELAARYPIHVVCAWMGHAAAIAQKHYLQVTDDDFDRGAESGAVVVQKAVRQPAADSRSDSQETTQARISPSFVREFAESCDSTQFAQVPRVGLEPTTR